MADIDAALLALAGDDSDEESTSNFQTQPVAAELESGEDSEDDERSRKPAPKPTSRRDRDNDAPSESGQSVAMSESEASAAASGEKLEDLKYPIEGKYTSEKDRAEIMALPEIQREQILAERADEIAREEQNRHLIALFRSYKGQEGDHKRKPDDTDLPEKVPRKKTAKDKALDEFRRKREERGAQKASGQKTTTRRADSEDPDADGESEPEWGEDRRRREETPEEQPVVLRDFEIIKVGRTNFAKVCFYPGFDTAMIGCYVRLLVGPDPKTRENQYRMAKIDSIVERVPYAIEKAANPGKFFITTQHVKVSIGKTTREAPLIYCSQGAFSQREMDFYLEELKKASLPPPKKSHLLAKNHDINALIRHTFTEKELGDKFGRSEYLQNRYREFKRAGLMREKERAEEDGDIAAVERIEEQLQVVATEPLKLRYNTSMPQAAAAQSTPTKKGEMTQQQRLAQLNRERAKADQQRIRNALLEESRVAERRRRALERGEPDPAPMARASTIPKTLHDSRDQPRAGTPVNGMGGAAPKDGTKKDVKMVDGKPVHNMFHSNEDLELPRPEWSFNYVEYSNNFLGARAMQHKKYDEQGRCVSVYPREMCDDEVIARMEGINLPIVEEY